VQQLVFVRTVLFHRDLFIHGIQLSNGIKHCLWTP